MNQVRCAYSGAILRSGHTPPAGEKALAQVSPLKVIPSFKPRRFLNCSAKRHEPPSYEDANYYRIPLLPVHLGDGKRGDYAHTLRRQRRSAVRSRTRPKSAAT
jgi:hypothetical protein